MAAYVVRVTSPEGFIKPPVVANCEDENDALRLVQAIADVDDEVEIKGITSDVMQAAFGAVPAGSAQFRLDWIWSEDGESPQPR